MLIVNGTNVSTAFRLDVIINNDTATNYYGVNMASGQNSTSNQPNPGSVQSAMSWSTWTTSQSFAQFNFMDYSATDKHKTVLGKSGEVNTAVEATAWRWASTAAITSLRVQSLPAGGSGYYLAAGTTMALYGVSA